MLICHFSKLCVVELEYATKVIYLHSSPKEMQFSMVRFFWDWVYTQTREKEYNPSICFIRWLSLTIDTVDDVDIFETIDNMESTNSIDSLKVIVIHLRKGMMDMYGEKAHNK